MNHLAAVAGYLQTHVVGVILAIVASFAVGFLWHGPLFGKPWAALNNIELNKADATLAKMFPAMIASVVMAFVQACVLGRTFEIVSLTGYGQALLIATILWLPFTALVIVNSYAWLQKPWKLMLLDSGYNLASMWAIAAVLYATL